jgi:cytochrome c oxidase assembly protein subunit 11
MNNDLSRKNRLMMIRVFVVVCVMLGLAYASVPLYNLFCRVTGFGGTTQISESLPTIILDREMTVRFDTNTARDLPWEFKSSQKEISLKIGEKGIANFTARNEATSPVAGTAVFNVTPLKAGKYFYKIQCFCFEEQILQPGQDVNMPVMFYVDPAIAEDEGMDDVSIITLSYSYFKSDSEDLEKAMQEFYDNQPE